MRSISPELVPVRRSRPAEARLDEKVDSPDGTQGVGYARRKPPLSGYRHNCSTTDQGRPGLFMTSQESRASRIGRETSGQS